MLFSKKWLRNHQKFLLYFQIHIDVLILCRKFEAIPSSNFRVMTTFKNQPISENFPVLAHAFYQKMDLKSPKNFYYIFRYTLMSLCYVESLSRFQAQIFEL